jgi:phytoene desaturase
VNKQVVVIGAGMGGLSAAVHARLNGHDVLVLEKGDTPGGKAAGLQIDGYRLDPGPSIVILTEIYEAVFRRAGRQMSDYLTFHRLDPFTRVYFEGAPLLDLPADREECLRLLSNRFPEDGLAIRSLMDRLDRTMPKVEASIFRRPFDQPWQMLDPNLAGIGAALGVPFKYKTFVDSWFKAPLLRAFFYGFPSYGGQTYDSVAPGALLIPYLMLSRGVYYPEGGVAAIPRAFHRLAEELGVEFRFGQEVVGLDVEKGRVTQVQTDSGGIACDSVISNVDRYTTGTWLGRKFNQRPSFSYFTMSVGVSRLVDGLSHHTLFVPGDFEQGFEDLYRKRVFPESPIVYMNATHLADPAVAPTGCSNLFMVVTSPALEEDLDWNASQTEARTRTLATLAKFGFTFDASEIQFERIQTPAYFAEAHGNYRGSLYGPDEKHRLFKTMPNRNWDEKVKNLFYCGGSVQPGAGLPMVTLSGKFAAERATSS